MNELRTRSWDDLSLNYYDIIYADPPWDYYGDPNKSQAAGKHYSMMSLEELSAMQVRNIMSKRSILFLWATCPKLDVAIDLIRAWKLTYRGVFQNWIKTTQGGKIITGQGARPSFTKPTSELLLVASTVSKGRPLQILDEAMAQVIAEPRPNNIHSRKPSICRENIDRLYGTDIKKIELFARTAHEGWDAWGNQVPINGEDHEERRNVGDSCKTDSETRSSTFGCSEYVSNELDVDKESFTEV